MKGVFITNSKKYIEDKLDNRSSYQELIKFKKQLGGRLVVYSDCHAHLHPFSDERVEEMVERGKEKGVDLVFAASIDYESSFRSLELADRYEVAYPCVGVHPWMVQEVEGEEIRKVLNLSRNRSPIISEVGLDFIYNSNNESEQIEVFRRFVEAGVEEGKPLILHVRGAFEEAIKIMDEFPQSFGAVHCFSGTVEEARAFGERGFYTSISNAVLSELSPQLKEVLGNLDLEKMVVDTDTLPGTFELSHAVDITHAIAREKNLSIEKTADVITSNSRSLLNEDI